ncbi:MAG TPA: hypothetical protein VK907_07115, partial [Phnomibacter sp.]|nr:hypothetical protein [Phnomibacter sp.]
MTISSFVTKNIILSVAIYQCIPFSEEDNKIFWRFAKVFEQTYTRFLDLQKAEGQAREAQIEAALEKVRSRSLAMHNSSELNEVVKVLFEKITELQVPSTAVGIQTFIEGSKDMQAFVCGDVGTGIIVNQYVLPYFDHPIVQDYINAHKNKMEAFVGTYSKKDKDSFYDVILKLPELNDLRTEVKTMIYDSDFYEVTIVPAERSLIAVNDFQGNPLSESQVNILKRFAKVFDQAYTRFLDLQKAEALARETQTELSLERIRAKVTAMQTSAELLDIVVLMRHEFVALGHEAHYFWYMRWLPEKYEKAMTSGDGTRIGMVMTLPRHIHGDIKLVADWEKSNVPSVVLAMDVETAVEYVHKMIALGDFQQVDPHAPTLDDIRHINGLTFVMARTTHGEIGYSLPGVVSEPPAEDIATLERFASVFDLAYKRFEDLKTSEHQHREAQIELALERVRSRSMAMHRSEELSDLSLELVKQVQALGVATWFCAFNIYDDDTNSSLEWGSNGQGVFSKYRTPREGVFLRYYEAGQRGETLLINEIGEDECPAHYEYLCSLPGVGDQLLQMKAAGMPFPTSQIDHVAFFNQGSLIFITYEPVPDARDIFKRFARVFEQSYTRFLDLQKAEAQAREAQIEAALERTRSQSMLMQHSGELNEISKTFHEQLLLLGIDPEFSFVWLPDEEKNEHMFWATWVNEVDGTSDYHSRAINYALDKTEPGTAACYVAWESGEPVIETFVPPGDINSFFATWEELLRGAEKLRPERFPDGIYYTEAYMKYGCFGIDIRRRLAADEKEIIRRFAVEFERAYTRFLDLKKAEAQAREAQIEAAMERVRSRSMGMQKSEELIEVDKIIIEQIKVLG